MVATPLTLNTRLNFGDGFYLGRIVRSDAPVFVEHFNDPEIARNLLRLADPYTEADAAWWVDHCESLTTEITFALREPSGRLIGGISIVSDYDPEDHTAEFGYWLAKDYRGKGLMPRAITAFANHCFETLKIHRLYATPFSFNAASHRALEKAGFQREGVMKHHHKKRGVYIDAVLFAKVHGA